MRGRESDVGYWTYWYVVEHAPNSKECIFNEDENKNFTICLVTPLGYSNHGNINKRINRKDWGGQHLRDEVLPPPVHRALPRWQVISSLSEIIKSNYITRNLCNYSRLFMLVVLFFIQFNLVFSFSCNLDHVFFFFFFIHECCCCCCCWFCCFFSLASTNLIISEPSFVRSLVSRYSFQRLYLSFLVADIS